MVDVWKAGTFTGETQSLEIAGALLTDVRHLRANRVPQHAHEAPYFSLLLEGSYSESAADFAIRYEPYTVVFHDRLTPHQDAIDAAGCRMFFVELLPAWYEVIDELRPLPAHLFELHGGTPLWLLMRLHREYLAGDSSNAVTVESLIYDLCSYLTTVPSSVADEPPWISRLDAVLQARFESRLPLRELARELGIHPAHMCRGYRRFRHRTIGDHVTGLRVQLVSRLLAKGDVPLGEIADAAGFSDQSHMTRAFSRVVGVAPGAYRRGNLG